PWHADQNGSPAAGTTHTNSATVVNSAPVATVSLDSASPKTNDTLTATATRSDADGDAVSLHYVWKNGATVVRDVTKSAGTSADLTDSLSLATAGNGNKGDTITVNETGNAHTSTAATVNDRTTAVNSAPVATVSPNDHSPKPNATPTRRSSDLDADGDAVSLHYVWKNGATVVRDVTKSAGTSADLTDSLSLATAGNGNKGDTITVN